MFFSLAIELSWSILDLKSVVDSPHTNSFVGSTSAPSWNVLDDTQTALQYAASLLGSWAKIQARGVKNDRNYHKYAWILCTKKYKNIPAKT